MDATLHSIIISQHVQDRIAEATSERAARDVKPRRWPTRRARPEVAADRSRPVTTSRVTATSS